MNRAALLLLAAACAPPPVETPATARLLQANVGNTSLACDEAGYVYKTCDVAVEEALRDGIAAHDADVVALQEVLPSSLCDALNEQDPTRTCHPDHRADVPDQVRRLLGDDFTIACDARRGYECVGVRAAWGAIEGCDDGALCVGGAETAPVVDGCDEGFSVSRVVVRPRDAAAFTIVNAHPQSGFEYACRAAQLTQMFDELAEGPSLITGDMNLDPWRDTDESARVWVENVGEDARFRPHSGDVEHDPPYLTSDVGGIAALSGTLDHVASDFATGTCTTLGEAPGTARLDGGEGTDHRALLCPLEIPR